ncbi:MAG: HAMP domain-containing sensor histidine kinase [Patescibacteria group bacterium]
MWYQSLRVKLLFVFFLLAVFPLFSVLLYIPAHYETLLQTVADTESDPSGQTALTIRDGVRAIHWYLVVFGVMLLLLIFAGAVAMSELYASPIIEIRDWLKRLRKSGVTNVEQPPMRLDEFGQVAQNVSDIVAYWRETEQREKEISRVKSEFISIAAHQLRTPLTAIKWIFGLLTDRGDKLGEFKEDVAAGYASTNRMIQLVNDLLDVARIEEGKFGYNFRDSDISDVVEKAMGQFRGLARKRRIRLDFVPPHAEPPPLYIDPERLGIALANIISNAVVYTPEKGVVTVTMALHQHEKKMEISVRDTGIGVPESERHRIFSKFYRSPAAILLQPDGSGLGLFIAQNVIQRHGGTIEVDSEEGHGSTFTVFLPLEKQEIPMKEIPFEEFFGTPTFKERAALGVPSRAS